jgi:hypothetical protein
MDLASDYRRPALLEFLADGRTLAVEQPYGLLVYEREDEAFGRIELEGRVTGVDVLSELGILLSTSRGDQATGGTTTIRATVLPDRPFLSQSVASDEVFVQGREARIYIGVNGRLACVELIEA